MIDRKLINFDACIIGGGIAGLWLAESLKSCGYKIILIEKYDLGSNQTIHSQGMLHGGVKYSLTGHMTKSADVISHMPEVWAKALTGRGQVDLSQTEVLSSQQFLWGQNNVKNKLLFFLANNSLKATSRKILKEDYPSLFDHSKFNGVLYSVDENVLNVPTLIKNFKLNLSGNIIKVKDTDVVVGSDGKVEKIIVLDKYNKPMALTASDFIFTCGEGNENYIQEFGLTNPLMQRRPLHMTYAVLDSSMSLYGHCMDNARTPRLTVSTHIRQDGKYVWYVGGACADSGLNRNSEQQIDYVRRELAAALPQIDHSKWQWDSFIINRAEPKTVSGNRPDDAYIYHGSNFHFVWPTKLTLAPRVAQIIHEKLKVRIKNKTIYKGYEEIGERFEVPKVSLPIWDQ